MDLSRGTTPEYMEYHNRYMADSVSGDSDESSIDSAVTPPARVRMEFKTYSDDGVNYFKTMAQLKAWRRERMDEDEAERKAQFNRPKNPLEGLIGREGVCEECEIGKPAVKYCVDCNELYCDNCYGLCHIMLDSKNHLQYDFPLTGLNLERFDMVRTEVEERDARAAAAEAAKAEAARVERERRHKHNMEKFGWDPDAETVASEGVHVCTFPRFRPNQRVLFTAIERSAGAGEVKGRIVPFSEAQIRRTDMGMFWYRVKYVDDTYPGDPEHVRTELVKETDLEDVEENERRKLVGCIRIIEMHEVQAAWNSWRGMVFDQRHAELEEHSATQIQRVFRGERGRVKAFYLRRERDERLAAQREREERKARKMARAARRRERMALARAKGITTDGINFFMNFNELHAWWDKRKAAAIMFKKILNKHWFQHAQRRALVRWREYLAAIDAAHVAEGDHLRKAQLAQEAWERAAAIRRAKRMSMMKLRSLTRLAGLKLFVSKVGAIPTNEHEEYKIEGTDRGVLKRIATQKALREQRIAEGKPAGDDDDDLDADRVSVVDDTDSDAEGPASGAGAGAGAGAGSSPGPGRRRRAEKPKGFHPELKWWVFCGGKTGAEAFGVSDDTGTTQTKLLVKKGTRPILATRVFYGNERKEKVPWHPAIDIRLPNLPYVGALARIDGTIQIDDITKYNSFKSAMLGPWDTSHWKIKGMLCIGAYPEGQAKHDNKLVTARSSAVAQILMSGLNTFVCLMTDDEVVRPHGKPYEDDIRENARTVRAALFGGLAAAKKSLERSAGSAAKAKTYAKEIRLRLEAQARKDKAKVRVMAERLQRFPNKLNFITFPIPEGQTAPDMHIIHLCENLEQRLRLGEKIYIFSRTGRGRAGTVAAALLGRIYGMTATDALEYNSRCNDAQLRQILIPPRAKKLEVKQHEVSDSPKNKKRKGSLKPISLDSKERDSKDNAFFGTTFSNFGRKKKKTAQQLRDEAARKRAAREKADRNARAAAVLDTSFVALTCSPSTNMQRQQVRRLLTYTDPIYDTVSTHHREGQFMFKPMRRNHGIPVILPSITQRSEIYRLEALQRKSNDRSLVPVRLGGVVNR